MGNEYHVAVGDVLEIQSSAGNPPEIRTIGADGAIQIGAHGQTVRVDNLSVDEIADKLSHQAGRAYRGCQVRVRQYGGQVIYLFGPDERTEPKALAYRGPEMVEDLVARSGCQNCRRGYRIRVVRPRESFGELPDVHTVRLDEYWRQKDINREPIVLQPGDYVYLEKDVGDPAKVARFRWYQKPSEWWKGRRDTAAPSSSLARHDSP